MLLLAPDLAGLWHEAGVLNARLGNLRAAAEALQEFIMRAPESGARHQAAALLQQLRSKLNSAAGSGPLSTADREIGLIGTFVRGPCLALNATKPRSHPMNNIIYIVGLIVIVLAILAFLGLR